MILGKIEPSELLHSCEECDFKFLSLAFLECHSSRIHDQDAASNHCKLCDITYKTSNGLWHHKMKIHTLELEAFRKDYAENDLLFDCTACTRKFATQTTLDHHMSRKHYALKQNLMKTQYVSKSQVESGNQSSLMKKQRDSLVE